MDTHEGRYDIERAKGMPMAQSTEMRADNAFVVLAKARSADTSRERDNPAADRQQAPRERGGLPGSASSTALARRSPWNTR